MMEEKEQGCSYEGLVVSALQILNLSQSYDFEPHDKKDLFLHYIG